MVQENSAFTFRDVSSTWKYKIKLFKISLYNPEAIATGII